jgi:hypothetical protein
MPRKVADQTKGRGRIKAVTELKMTRAGRGRNPRDLRIERNLIAALTAVLGLLTLTATARPQPAADSRQAKEVEKRRVIPVTINKGATYTISGLEKGSATNWKAVANPNSLSVQPQPSGDLVLLGTEGGSWKINATLATGEKVTYEVKIKADAPPINALTPGSAPTAMAP